MNKQEVLRAITFQLDRAQRAYQLYRERPVYLHACNIYKGNAEVVNLLLAHGGSFDGALREGLLDLLEHLDVWTEQFHHLEDELNPGAETEFVFERFPGTKPFPQNIRDLIDKELKISAG